MSDRIFHVWAWQTRNFASGIEGRAMKTVWCHQSWWACAGQLLPKQSMMTNARTKFTSMSRRISRHADGKEMRRHDVAHVEWSLRCSWSSFPQMLSKWPQGRHVWQLFSLMLNQFWSVKPGCLQLVGENHDSHHGPHSCISGLYKHSPGTKCLLLASLCYNRKCCCFLYLSCSQSLHGKHCLPRGPRMWRTCSILWPVPTSWSHGSVPLKTLLKPIWKWAELCNAMAEKLLVRN